MSLPLLQARVFNLRYEARDIISVELRPASPEVDFPFTEAGSHIDLHLGNGLIRSYSLTNPGESQRYVVAVLKDRKSRGGSLYVHEQLRVGQVISISAPRNNFRLDEDACQNVLLAGGIGITPLYAMLKRLSALGRRTHLIYCARSRSDAAFVEDIQALVSDSCDGALSSNFHFDEERGVAPDLVGLLGGFSPETHFYCCGPGPMLEAYESACEKLGYTNVHVERFAAKPALTNQVADPVGYTVELKKSGKTVQVPPGTRLLDALLSAGCKVEFSCREGVCGACETRVISGEVEHRDSILTQKERAANKSMMICVSSCKSGTLVLDA
ncbi:MAG: PDR/VanB family oxidoreductase [Curvibacter sp.]